MKNDLKRFQFSETKNLESFCNILRFFNLHEHIVRSGKSNLDTGSSETFACLQYIDCEDPLCNVNEIAN